MPIILEALLITAVVIPVMVLANSYLLSNNPEVFSNNPNVNTTIPFLQNSVNF